MLPNPESYERRSRMLQAPKELIEPIKKLVGVVSDRLRDCEPDDMGRRCIRLVGVDGAYHLQLMSVGSDRVSEFSALFVGGFVVNPETGELFSRLEEIQIPGTQNGVSLNKIYILRDCDPDEIEGLAEIIRTATPLETDYTGFQIMIGNAAFKRIPDLDDLEI